MIEDTKQDLLVQSKSMTALLGLEDGKPSNRTATILMQVEKEGTLYGNVLLFPIQYTCIYNKITNGFT